MPFLIPGLAEGSADFCPLPFESSIARGLNQKGREQEATP